MDDVLHSGSLKYFAQINSKFPRIVNMHGYSLFIYSNKNMVKNIRLVFTNILRKTLRFLSKKE